MPVRYRCPGCGSVVLIPEVAAAQIGPREQVGCDNSDEHDDGEPLVMWED